jgi:lysophospholipase L1-like esterase
MQSYEKVLLAVFSILLCVVFVFMLALFIKGPADVIRKFMLGTHQAMITRSKNFFDPTRKCNILLIGDSLALGVGASSPHASISGNIFSKTNCNVDTSAISGKRIGNLPELIPHKLAKFNAVIVILGANDFALYESYLPNAVVYNMVEEALKLLRSKFPKPIPILWATYVHPTVIPTLATNLVKDANLTGWQSGMYFKEILEQRAKHYDVNVENFNDISYMPPQFISKDGVHPNNLGYDVMSNYIIRGIK